jgi:type II secretory pathway component GspD/PulD (secretin)
MKTIRYINRTAGVPWFSKIPILGFFFRSKGLDDEVQNLMVLVRAHITDLNPLRESVVAR